MNSTDSTRPRPQNGSSRKQASTIPVLALEQPDLIESIDEAADATVSPSSKRSVLQLTSKRIVLLNDSIAIAQSAVISPIVKPFLKWAGGKQWLSPAAPNLAPKGFKGRYFEPFLGGGAFYFALEPAQATLSDINSDLISTYKAVATRVRQVISLLKSYRHDKEFYEQIRSERPATQAEIASRFIYLNKTCWNGLYRVNRQGRFNTPFGRYENPTICDQERLEKASRMIRRAALLCTDFEVAVSTAKKGDFVYFDPPYITKHIHNGFLKYNAALFSWDDQVRLAKVVKRLTLSGVHVLLSNAAHSSVQKLYSGLFNFSVMRRSLIGADNDYRGWTFEVLFSNYKLDF